MPDTPKKPSRQTRAVAGAALIVVSATAALLAAAVLLAVVVGVFLWTVQLIAP